MKTATTLKRTIAAALAFLYGTTNVLLANSQETNIWESRRQAKQVQLAQLPVNANAFSFPLQRSLAPIVNIAAPPIQPKSGDLISPVYGTLRKVSLPSAKSKGTVIHIQDIHMNQEAQSNIAGAVQDLVNKQKVGLVALEGAFGRIDLSRIQNYPQKDTTRAVADYLLEQNKISGPVHSLMTTAGPAPHVIGVDDRTSYRANVEAYKHSAPLIKEATSILEKRIAATEQEKQRVFSPALLKWDRHVQAYRKGTLSFGDYITALAERAPQHSTDMELLLEAFHTEKTLDFANVERERSEIVSQLSRKLEQQQIDRLLNQTILYRTGQLSHGAFYGYLRSLCESAHVPLSRFKAMESYIQYTLLAEGINAEKILNEARVLEEKAYYQLIHSSAEKKIVEASRRQYLTGKLLDFALTKEEWQSYKLLAVGRKYKISGSELTAYSLQPFENFYKEAENRDKKMAENLLSSFPNNGSAVLVTGGFHSQGIDKHLTAAGYTVITFVPKISKVESENGTSYLSVFTQKKTPLDKLFAGEKLFLAKNPVDVAGFPFLAALAEEAKTPYRLTDEVSTNLRMVGLPTDVTMRDVKSGVSELKTSQGTVRGELNGLRFKKVLFTRALTAASVFAAIVLGYQSLAQAAFETGLPATGTNPIIAGLALAAFVLPGFRFHRTLEQHPGFKLVKYVLTLIFVTFAKLLPISANNLHKTEITLAFDENPADPDPRLLAELNLPAPHHPGIKANAHNDTFVHFTTLESRSFIVLGPGAFTSAAHMLTTLAHELLAMTPIVIRNSIAHILHQIPMVSLATVEEEATRTNLEYLRKLASDPNFAIEQPEIHGNLPERIRQEESMAEGWREIGMPKAEEVPARTWIEDLLTKDGFENEIAFLDPDTKTPKNPTDEIETKTINGARNITIHYDAEALSLLGGDAERAEQMLTHYPTDWEGGIHTPGLDTHKRVAALNLSNPIALWHEENDVAHIYGGNFTREDYKEQTPYFPPSVGSQHMNRRDPQVRRELSKILINLGFDKNGKPVGSKREFVLMGGQRYEDAERRFHRLRGLLPRLRLKGPIPIAFGEFTTKTKKKKSRSGFFIALESTKAEPRLTDIISQQIKKLEKDIAIIIRDAANKDTAQIKTEVEQSIKKRGVAGIFRAYGRGLRQLTDIGVFPSQPHPGNMAIVPSSNGKPVWKWFDVGDWTLEEDFTPEQKLAYQYFVLTMAETAAARYIVNVPMMQVLRAQDIFDPMHEVAKGFFQNEQTNPLFNPNQIQFDRDGVNNLWRACYTEDAAPLPLQTDKPFIRLLREIHGLDSTDSNSEGPAMTRSGKALTAKQHAIVNKAIADIFTNARRIAITTLWANVNTEYKILDPHGALAKENIEIWLVSGLNHRIRKLCEEAGIVSPGLVSHPGRSRKVIYLDLLVYRDILDNKSETWRAQWAAHELAHIQNPALSEAEVQAIAPLPIDHENHQSQADETTEGNPGSITATGVFNARRILKILHDSFTAFVEKANELWAKPDGQDKPILPPPPPVFETLPAESPFKVEKKGDGWNFTIDLEQIETLDDLMRAWESGAEVIWDEQTMSDAEQWLDGSEQPDTRRILQVRNWMLSPKSLSPRGRNVLDLGTGTGEYALALYEAGAKHVTTIEKSPKIVELARKNIEEYGAQDSVTVDQGDVLALPYADGSFDAVYDRQVGMYLPPFRRTTWIAEMFRVLRDGGKICLYEPDPEMVKGDTEGVFGMSAVEWNEKLTGRGFVDINIQYEQGYLVVMATKPIMEPEKMLAKEVVGAYVNQTGSGQATDGLLRSSPVKLDIGSVFKPTTNAIPFDASVFLKHVEDEVMPALKNPNVDIKKKKQIVANLKAIGVDPAKLQEATLFVKPVDESRLETGANGALADTLAEHDQAIAHGIKRHTVIVIPADSMHETVVREAASGHDGVSVELDTTGVFETNRQLAFAPLEVLLSRSGYLAGATSIAIDAEGFGRDFSRMSRQSRILTALIKTAEGIYPLIGLATIDKAEALVKSGA